CRFHLWKLGATRTQVRSHIVWGDSLLGTLPGTMSKDLGAAAFVALMGDDKTVARAAWEAYREAPAGAQPDPDAWCAMLMWPRDKSAPPPPVRLARSGRGQESPETLALLETMVDQYRYVHWQRDFPEVFGDGFDVVLGNPPWERIEVQDKEWFARRAPHIKAAANAAARKRLVEGLAVSDPALHRAWLSDRRRSQAENHFMRVSGRFPLTGKGGINRYAPFTEACRQLIRPGGRVGYVVPSGLVHDENTRPFFRDLIRTGSLLNVHHFDNRKKLFPAVGGMITFCLVTMSNQGKARQKASFVCFAQTIEHLSDRQRRFELSAADLRLINPNTETLPIFRSRLDADITRQVYEHVPVLIRQGGENPWGLHLSMLFQMSNDSHLFRTADQLKGAVKIGLSMHLGQEIWVPLYEAKMLHQFDHRWASWQGDRALTGVRRDQGYEVCPRYWVPAAEMERRLARRWPHDWLLVWRDVCRSTDERTVIAAILPRVGVGHTAQLMFPQGPAPLLLANLNSLVLDYVARQKIGGIHLTYSYLQQLPILPPEAYPPELAAEITTRAVRLACTSDSVRGFGRSHGQFGCAGWNAEQRADDRAWLDATYFRLYGLDARQVEHVLSTFPIVRRKEEARLGEYRTRRLVLEYLRK
ncbi:MAG TPA: hypothetical protein VGO93_17210, partial [Candidatus Xenobia bacterium]